MTEAGTTQKSGSKVAIILVRGLIKVHRDVKSTLKLLNLAKKHTLVIVPDTPITRGMLTKIKDVATFGTISQGMISEITSKRKNLSTKKDGLKFHLNSPRGGFERKGIKTSFAMGGALGERKDKIAELIKKML
jgi:large subunit ribosomal protein L30